jgi:molybdate transport system permease protein
MTRRAAATAALGLLVAIPLAFLVVPLAGLLTHVPPHTILSSLDSSVARDALRVSLECSLASLALTLAFGTPLAYVLGRWSSRWRAIPITAVELPLVLPPAAAGIALLVTFGHLGLLGGTLSALGVSIAFNQAAVIVAITFVSSPFYVRGAIAAFEAVDPVLLDVGATLGAGRVRRMLRIATPIAASGLSAGATLAFARGLGEFGATILFAGSLQGTTQTLPLAIYSQFDSDFNGAIALSALLVVLSAAILLTSKLVPAWINWRSGSASLDVAST